MSDVTAGYFSERDKQEKQSRLQSVAAQIRNDFQLQTMLLQIDRAERRTVYEALKPNLKFTPLSFKRLMRLSQLCSDRPRN